MEFLGRIRRSSSLDAIVLGPYAAETREPKFQMAVRFGTLLNRFFQPAMISFRYLPSFLLSFSSWVSLDDSQGPSQTVKDQVQKDKNEMFTAVLCGL